MTAGFSRLRPPRLRRPRIVRALDHGQHAELVDHLGELRTRLVVCMVAMGLTFGVAFAYHEQLVLLLNGTLPAGTEPVTLGIAEPFLTSIKISLWAAFALSMPVILSQLWGFVRPAFDSSGRRAAVTFMLAGTLLFAGGAAFGYFVALPSAVTFLTSYDAQLYDVQVRAKDFYTFAAAVIVSVGLVFELPVVLLGLVRFGVLSSRKLRENRKVGYVALTALAVLLPGVDPVLTVLELLPLAVLFEATIWLSVIMERRWRPTEPA